VAKIESFIGKAPAHEWMGKPEQIDSFAAELACDIVVVGAGIAGVAAAQAAAEAGADVICVEKFATQTAHGTDVCGVDTKLQHEQGITIDKALAAKLIYQWGQSQTNYALTRYFVEHSGEVMDYYIDRMANQAGIEVFLGAQGEAVKLENPCLREYPTTHQFYGRGQKTAEGEYVNHLFVRHVEGWAKEDGAEIRYNTKAEQLVQDETGKVTGVVASTAAGYVKFNAKNGVILATGGIDGNPDMLKMWAPLAYACPSKVYSPAGGNTGDGICLGMWAGAAHQKTSAAPMFLPSSAALGGQLSNDGGNLCWLAVNAKGERYCAEDVNGSMQSFATAKQPGALGYSVFDSNYATDIYSHVESGLARNGKPYVDETLEGKIADEIADGLMFKGETIAELAEALGADPATLEATVARYNEMCEKGVDDDFGKGAKYLTKIAVGPFYASRIRCALLVVPYGLNVDSHSQVCDENDQPIEGLYAIGNVQGNFFTDGYPILCPGISHGRAMTFGRLVGQALAKGEKI